MKDDRNLFSWVKDVGLRLISVSALILVLNFGIVTVNIKPDVLELIRWKIIISSYLLIVSIICGSFTLFLLMRKIEDKSNNLEERISRWLSTIQFLSFASSLVFLAWALSARLGVL